MLSLEVVDLSLYFTRLSGHSGIEAYHSGQLVFLQCFGAVGSVI